MRWVVDMICRCKCDFCAVFYVFLCLYVFLAIRLFLSFCLFIFSVSFLPFGYSVKLFFASVVNHTNKADI